MASSALSLVHPYGPLGSGHAIVIGVGAENDTRHSPSGFTATTPGGHHTTCHYPRKAAVTGKTM